MSDARGRVLVVGDVMTDIIVVPEGPMVRGSDRKASIRMKPGGSGANQAVWLGAFGVPVSFVARVGAADKPHLEAYFRGHYVEPVLTSDSVRPSGVLVVMVSPDGERSFLTDRGANLALSASDMPEWLLDVTSLVLISGYSFFAEGPRQAVQWLCEVARERDIDIAVDSASAGFLLEAGPEKFIEWSRGAATIFANRDEAETLTGETELEAQMRALGRHYTRVVIKRGEFGAALGDASGVLIELPAPKVAVLDTTGAGDAFAAGFLAAESRGEPLEARLKAGIEAGSKAVQQVGGQPG